MVICCCCGEILPEEQAIITFAGDECPDEEAICPDCWEESRRWRLRAAAGAGYWLFE